MIGIDIFSLQNSEDYWEEPEKFRPERFLEKDYKIESDDSMTFLPFGVGKYIGRLLEVSLLTSFKSQ